eukprot:1140893-Pelagomonas_calceolata.AAC.3
MDAFCVAGRDQQAEQSNHLAEGQNPMQTKLNLGICRASKLWEWASTFLISTWELSRGSLSLMSSRLAKGYKGKRHQSRRLTASLHPGQLMCP